MSIGCFVRGLIPFLALLSDTEKVPKPTNTTLPPAFTSSAIVSSVASNAFFESTLLRPDFSAIALINSDLFIRKLNKEIKHILFARLSPDLPSNIDDYKKTIKKKGKKYLFFLKIYCLCSNKPHLMRNNT